VHVSCPFLYIPLNAEDIPSDVHICLLVPISVTYKGVCCSYGLCLSLTRTQNEVYDHDEGICIYSYIYIYPLFTAVRACYRHSQWCTHTKLRVRCFSRSLSLFLSLRGQVMTATMTLDDTCTIIPKSIVMPHPHPQEVASMLSSSLSLSRIRSHQHASFSLRARGTTVTKTIWRKCKNC